MAKKGKLLEKMRRSKAGWKHRDLESLYLSFGFEKKEGRGHTLYLHPKFPELMATVTRHKTLAKGYIDFAIKLIDKLEKIKGGK